MQCSCDVDVDVGSDEMPSFHVTTKPVSWIHRRCGECGETIDPGEQYEHVAGVWDGRWDTYVTCMDCLSVREQFFTDYRYGQIWEDLENTFEEWGYEVPETCIAALSPGARDKVCEMIEAEWEEE
ncbi:MAG: hypothetical protein ABXS91_11200 [Sulfurimonas sp.]